jgi:hypothetical protein
VGVASPQMNVFARNSLNLARINTNVLAMRRYNRPIGKPVGLLPFPPVLARLCITQG